MRAYFTVLLALTTLIALLASLGLASSDPVDDLCKLTFTDEQELRWSTEQETFVIVSFGDNDSSPTLQQSPSTVQSEDHRSRSLLCIRAPEGHFIVLQFIYNLPEENNSLAESSSCDPSTHDCTTHCVTVHEPKGIVDDNHKFETINGSVLNVSRDISLEFFSLNYTQNLPRVNSTKFDEHVERFPRHSTGSSGDTSLRIHDSPKKEGRRRQRKHCRKCAKGQHVSNKKHSKKRKRNRWKALAAELLIELHKRLLADREAAAKRNATTKDVKNSPSLEVQEARDQIFLFINSSRRRRLFASPESLQRTALRGSNPLQRMPGIHDINSPPIEESEAHDRERRRAEMSETLFSASEQSKTRLSSFTFCGPGPTSNISTVTGESVQESLRSSEDFIRRKFPLTLHSDGQEMRINILQKLPTDDALFQFLQIKISFASMQQETENMLMTTNYVPNGDITPTKTQAMRSSAPRSGSKINPNDPCSTGDEVTVGYRDDEIHIIIGVVMGGVLVFVLTAACVILLYRKKSRAAHSYASKSRQHGPVDEGEIEKCLSSAENCEPRTDYNSPKKRKGPENITQNLTEVNERRMVENKKLRRSHHKPGKVLRKEDITDSRKSPEAKHQQHSRQHVTQCKHLLTMRASSRHEHCIVCQIAGKPHQPIMNAQYAAYLPPASRRNNNSGFNSSAHDNFDKFNRMQNNPYRHSPSLMPKNTSSPWTVKLPDGEERYKIQPDLKLHAEGYRDAVCVKPPPNRTIFASEPLPFSGSSRQKHCGKANGYPGPPTSIPKGAATFDRTGREGRSRTSPKDDCLCRYIINHIDDPPPEYSDVMRGDPVPLGAENIASYSGSPTMGLRKKIDVLNSPPNT